MKALRILAIVLLVAGNVMVGVALGMKPYTDEAQYTQSVSALEPGQSSLYAQIRDEFLTPKFPLTDYGVTLTVCAVLLFVATYLKKSPRNKYTLLAVGLCAVVAQFFGGYAYLMVQAGRGEYFHFADSLSIPLMFGVVMMAVSLLVVVGTAVPMFFRFHGGEQFTSGGFGRVNITYFVLALLATVALVTFAATSAYELMPAAALYVYYFASLSVAVGRRVATA